MNAVPEDKNKTRADAQDLSRRDLIERAGREVELPEIECAGHLVRYLFEVGPYIGGGMAPAALSFQELAAWSSLTCISLNPWESITLRRLSNEYIQEYVKAAAPNHPAPYASECGSPEKAVVANDMRAAVKSLANL